MPIRNTKSQYGSVAKLLHWVIFIIIVMMLTMGFVMDDIPNGPDKIWVYGLHKSLGISVLILITIRLLWKLANISPSLPAHMKAIERLMAKGAHWALYLLLIVMPLSGWLMSSAAGFPVSVFGLFTLPNLIEPDRALVREIKEIHEFLAYCIIGMVSLHALAALLHHFYHKDNVLRKMLPFVKVNEDGDA